MTDPTERTADVERRPDDPHFELRFMDDETVEYELQLDDFQLALYPDESRISIGLSGNDLTAVRALKTIQHRIIAGTDARIARLEQDRDAYKGASRDCHDALGRCAVERDTALRDADELRAQVGRLRAENLRLHGKIAAGEFEHITANTKSLRHPRTGDTEATAQCICEDWSGALLPNAECPVHITRTGRILETRSAASGEDVERAREAMEEALVDDENPAWNERTVQAIAADITAARLSGRAEMREIAEAARRAIVAIDNLPVSDGGTVCWGEIASIAGELRRTLHTDIDASDPQ